MGILRHFPTHPAVIVPITGKTRPAIREAAVAIAVTAADLVEWRADCFTELDDMPEVVAVARRIKEITGKPLIFTIRSTAEGGLGQLSAEEYAFTTLRVAIDALDSDDYVDVELHHPGTAAAMKLRHSLRDLAGTIISHHDFAGTPSPDDMYGLLEQCAALGDGAVKLAVTPHCPSDVAALLQSVARFTERYEVPTIAVSMGKLGVASRAVGHLFGSCATFATLGEASAPGQLSYHKMRRLLDELS
ncbi:MAG: type I 3-dehydroquinate dehydratase [Propionibacteriaceae bacterium]|jgi:3-dehydroquinate dehydratase-1|nr:type I 3-dehydroquinate dehydratase [Propionibacteriaceae bacterium]